MKTILIVDDDASFHFLCEMVFQRSGEPFTLLKALDGLQALEILRTTEQTPDLILLDINMPRMNGHEFLAEYEKIATSEIPVVAMLTSSDQRRDRDNAMSYPFVRDYILKPIRKEHIERLKDVHAGICEKLAL